MRIAAHLRCSFALRRQLITQSFESVTLSLRHWLDVSDSRVSSYSNSRSCFAIFWSVNFIAPASSRKRYELKMQNLYNTRNKLLIYQIRPSTMTLSDRQVQLSCQLAQTCLNPVDRKIQHRQPNDKCVNRSYLCSISHGDIAPERQAMDKEASLLAPAVVGYEYVKLTAVDHAREWREPSLTLTQFCALFKTVKILKTLEDVPLMNTTLAPPLQFKLQKMLHECKMYLLIGIYLLIYILNRKSYLGCHFSCLISSQLLFIGHSCQCQCQVHISLIETRIIWRKRPLTTH